MRSGPKLALAALLAAVGASHSAAQAPITDYRNCYYDGTPPFCEGRCRPGYHMFESAGGLCITGRRVMCCEPMGHISQGRKRKSPNSAKVIKGTPRPNYTPKVTLPPHYSSAKVIKGVPRPNHPPKYPLPGSTNKIPASAKVIKGAPRPASYSSKHKFPKLYGSPLR